MSTFHILYKNDADSLQTKGENFEAQDILFAILAYSNKYGYAGNIVAVYNLDSLHLLQLNTATKMPSDLEDSKEANRIEQPKSKRFNIDDDGIL